MKGLRQEDLVNQELITELRKEFGMTYDEFYMVLTDTDMRVKVRIRSARNLPAAGGQFKSEVVTWKSEDSRRCVNALSPHVRHSSAVNFHFPAFLFEGDLASHCRHSSSTHTLF